MNAKKIKLSPSLLASDFSKLGEEITAIEKAGADYIHLDVMDGSFVPNISFGMPVIQSLRKMTDKIFDVHLMIEEPIRFVKDLREAGADIITVQAEACKHLDRTIMLVKESGCKCGVALNPATSLAVLDYVLDKIDMVLIMSVNPGFGGQAYITGIENKVAQLRSIIDAKGLDVDIQVDGGLTTRNTHKVLAAGANVIVAGSAIFKGNIPSNVKAFKTIFEEFENE